MIQLKWFVAIASVLALGLVIACAPATAPTSSPATAQPTDSAMMAKETDTAMMMAKETDTAMMAKETNTAMMMAKETDTAMMAKETESAMMMAKETDTAMMAKETESAMMAKPTEAAMPAKPTDAMPSGDAMMPKFPPQQFAAHFVDSTPMHETTLTAAPKMVQLNFNFTLSPASTIAIERDGQAVSNAPGKLSDNKLAMTTELPADAGMGLYLIKYKACWPDNSCHNGQFAFYVK